jgi:hypothetical protein
VPLLLGEFTHFNEVIPGAQSHRRRSALQLRHQWHAGIGECRAFRSRTTKRRINTGTSPADDDIVTITTPIVNVPILVGTDLYFSTC